MSDLETLAQNARNAQERLAQAEKSLKESLKVAMKAEQAAYREVEKARGAYREAEKALIDWVCA